MKKLILYIFILPYIFIGCGKDNSADPIPTPCVPDENIISTDTMFDIYYKGLQEHGYATAIKLNKEWESSFKALKEDSILLFWFRTVISPDYLYYDIEGIHISGIKLENKCYNLNMDSTISTIKLLKDYDVVLDVYSLYAQDPNFLEVDSINIETNFISGNFMFSFQRDTTRKKRPYHPDYVRFFNGRFAGTIVE